MLDLDSFRDDHPHLCSEERIRIPGLVSESKLDGLAVENSSRVYKKIMRDDPWEEPPIVRLLMQEEGAEAFGYYLSFRLDPGRWGIYFRVRPIIGLAKEVLRVLNLGFVELKESVSLDLAREMAFGMAFDLAFNHLSFHAAVDAFTAKQELEDGTEYYGPYLQGPYADSLANLEEEVGSNLEEVLANVVSLRSFFNPTMAVELGNLVNDSFSEEERFRWNAYLMSGTLTTEMTYILRAYPRSYRNFTQFFRRRGEVGPYAHMAIQYDLDANSFNEALRRLSGLILKGSEVEGAEREMLKPMQVKLYLVPED
ncbi:MAG: hypothetical protein LN412_06895 [Candidatus Thermoplasmatota archaeon]|nr:hypothetical protein [Candidatus Thermoplasmatota archaeon]